VQIDSTKDDQIISIRDGDCRRYLVHWKDRSESDDTWITQEDLQQLALDLLEFCESHLELYSTRSSSFHPGSTDEGITLVPLPTYKRLRRHVTSAPLWLWF